MNVEMEEKVQVVEEEQPVTVTESCYEWLHTLVTSIVMVVILLTFVFRLVVVDGASMMDTLYDKDQIFVTNFCYTPQCGDVVVISKGAQLDKPIIKRVIATEGDTVYIDFRTGDVYVNDEVIDEDYIKDETREKGSYITELIKNGNYSKESPIVIQPGYIFVMGDNRNNSKDSRHLGPVPIDEVMGGAVFRFWPLSDAGSVHRDAE